MLSLHSHYVRKAYRHWFMAGGDQCLLGWAAD